MLFALTLAFGGGGTVAVAGTSYWGNYWQPSSETHYHLGTANGSTNNVYDYRFSAPKSGSVTALGLDILTWGLGEWTNIQWKVQFRNDSAGLPGTVIREKVQTAQLWFQGWSGGTPRFFSNWPELNDPVVMGHVYHITLVSAEPVYWPTPWRDCEPGYYTGTALADGGAPTLYWRASDLGVDSNQATLTSSDGGATWTARNPGPFGVKFSDGSMYGNGPYTIATHVSWRVYANHFSGEVFRFTPAERMIAIGAGVCIRSVGAPADTAYLTLKDETAGKVVFNSVALSGITATMNWVDAALPAEYVLYPGRQYRLYISSPGSADQNNAFQPGNLDCGAGGAQADLSFQNQTGYGTATTDGGASWASYSTWWDLQFRFLVKPFGKGTVLIGR